MKGKKVYNSKALVWWGLAGVVLLAFILRLAWVLNVHTYPISDFGWYHERALGLIHGQGYSVNGKPTAYWPIGYPLFLAGLYKLFGPHYYVAKAANVIMGSLTAGLTYLIGNRLAGFWTGLFAGLALALMPSQIEWTSVLCSEILFTFLLLASTYLLVVKRPERQGWLYPAVSGLLLGAASLVRATSLALPLGAFVFYWIFRRSFRQAKFIQLLGVKFRKFYQSDTNAYLFSLTPTHPPLPEALKDRITSIANYYYRTLMVLALAGTGICLFWWRRVRDWPTLVALAGVILYFTAVHSVMPAWDRYRFPIMPFFAVLAGCTPGAIVALGQQLIRGRRSR